MRYRQFLEMAKTGDEHNVLLSLLNNLCSGGAEEQSQVYGDYFEERGDPLGSLIRLSYVMNDFSPSDWTAGEHLARKQQLTALFRQFVDNNRRVNFPDGTYISWTETRPLLPVWFYSVKNRNRPAFGGGKLVAEYRIEFMSIGCSFHRVNEDEVRRRVKPETLDSFILKGAVACKLVNGLL